MTRGLFTIRRKRQDGTFDYGQLWSTREGAELEREHGEDQGHMGWEVIELVERKNNPSPAG